MSSGCYGRYPCLHLAIALKKLIVTFFGPPVIAKLTFMDGGKNLVADVAFVQCYRGNAYHDFAGKYSANDVFQACKEVLNARLLCCNYLFDVEEKNSLSFLYERKKIGGYGQMISGTEIRFVSMHIFIFSDVCLFEETC